MTTTKHKASRKVMQGTVVSSAMDKTVVVAVETRKPHSLYKKIVTSTRKYKAHDENNACAVGDIVRIIETRPLSKSKNWKLVEIVEKAK